MQLTLLFYLVYPISVASDDLKFNFVMFPCEPNNTECSSATDQETSHEKSFPLSTREVLHSQETSSSHSTETIDLPTEPEGFHERRQKTQSEKSLELPFGGVLYPRASESRDLLSLDGLWRFILDTQEKGMRERWFEKDISNMADTILMPVPSSYNDITTSASVRDHVGLVWYQRTFFIPASWKTQQQRLWLRFGGVNYLARVWINGGKVLEHEVGHLPFQGEITKLVNFGMENKVTVSVDNRLKPETVPQGTLEPIDTIKGPKIIQKYSYGFYNYAGIHRPVYLYSTPKVYIDDIWLKSKFQGSLVFLHYRLFCKGVTNKEEINASIAVIDKDGNKVGYQSQIKMDIKNVSGDIQIDNPKLWWPYLMSPDPGYLYTVEIIVKSVNTGITDVYRHMFGLRNISWDNKSIFINKKPFYIRGISRHEDSDVRGRGLDLPTAVRDHNLLKWLGANTYRTSHCPHAEESMDLAEQMGLMVIDEVPSINTQNFTDNLLKKHKMALAELIHRDKNRACVLMWSVANEPVTETAQSGPYFGSVVGFTRWLDDTRPITAILNRWHTVDQAAQWMDIICFNRYNGYFKEPGQLEIIQPAVEKEARYWHNRHNKPVIMSEYGTEAYEGLHGLPEYLWTEEFQNTLLSEHFKAFDNLREEGWFIGEMVYSFTDFKTDQSTKRVGGRQKKGIFNRGRQPKSAAIFIRKRNFKLAAMMNETSLPSDLELYYAPTK